MPHLYWDGYGLNAPGSGVFIHARKLATELLKLGVEPTLILDSGLEGAGRLFADLPQLTLPPLGWPMRVDRGGSRGSDASFAPTPALPVAAGAAPLDAFLARLGRVKPVWNARVGRTLAAARVGTTASGPAVVHGLSNINLPLRRLGPRLRRVLTVHDLIPLLAPEAVSTAAAWQFRYLLPRALAAADQVICVSAWTKETIADRFPAAAGKCQVIANGIERPAWMLGSASAAPDAAHVDCGAEAREDTAGRARPIQLLYVARFELYKNHTELLALVRRSRLKLELTLVTDQRGAEFCRRTGADLVASGRLIVLSYQPPSALAHFYARADVYISPSRYEGFCLPAVEALCAGTPVVYQAGSGIDEVVGTDVGTGLPPGAPFAQWEEAILAAAAKRRTAGFRTLLAARLSALPSWSEAASALAQVYAKLL